jgi:hypothetical protein
MFLLTSLNRVKCAIGIINDDQDAILGRIIPAVSKRIANHLKRDDDLDGYLELKSRVEYIDPTPDQKVFYPKAYPISSITSIYTDSTGLYTGSEALVASTNYLIGSDQRSIVAYFDPSAIYPYFPVYPRGVKLTYVAGLAASGVVSSWTKSTEASTAMTVGNYIKGSLSGFMGKITARAAGTISYECLAGVAQAGETITEYTTFSNALTGGGVSTSTAITCTLTAVTAQSLAEAHTPLVEAAEMLINYFLKNRNDFNSLIVSRDGENRSSRSDMQKDYFGTPEVRDLLEPYKNKLLKWS